MSAPGEEIVAAGNHAAPSDPTPSMTAEQPLETSTSPGVLASDRHAEAPAETSISKEPETSSDSETSDESPEHDVTMHSDTGGSDSSNPVVETQRDAPESLSPTSRGLETDENPQLPSEVNRAARVDTPPMDSRQLKHLSTTSFARTVSHDVNWGEDDDVDPEWNVGSSETDRFASMSQFDRTNSFPPVPPAHKVEIHSRDVSLPRNQTEEIMGEVKRTPADLFADDDGDDSDFFAQQEMSAGGISASSAGYDRPFGGDYEPDASQDAEARYEEGVPLVESNGELESNETKDGSGPAFDVDDGSADADFFAQVGQSIEDERPSLGRKSTQQVLGGLQFENHNHGNHDIIEEADKEEDEEDEEEKERESSLTQDTFDRATGGGVGASKSTILTQALADPENPVIEAAVVTEEGDSEADLAAKWKAALEGDEFLDDEDELLADEARQTGMDPATLFGSDDEGFLDDTEEPDAFTGLSSQGTNVNGGGSANRYIPSAAAPATSSVSSPYAPVAPLLADSSKPLQSPAMPSPYASPYGNQQAQTALKAEQPKAESFAAKSKGGYTSPYDLPMEIVKPRRRVSMQQLHQGGTSTVSPILPPPRSSSVNPLPAPPSARSAPNFSPAATNSQTFQQNEMQPPKGTQEPKPSLSAPPSKATFFEELPVSSKPKPAARHHTVGPVIPTAPPYSAPGAQNPVISSSLPPPPQPVQGGLVPPERVSPYASLPSSTMPGPVPAASSRYSPAPPMQDAHTVPPAQSRYSPAPPMPEAHTVPPVQSRYSPAPPPRPTAAAYSSPQPTILPHQPRTSSPLAHFERSPQIRPHSGHGDPTVDRRSSSSGSGYEPPMKPSLPPTREEDEEDETQKAPQTQPSQPSYAPLSHGGRQISQTPPPQSLSPKSTLSPAKRSNSSYIPDSTQNGFASPPRSKTQSPTATRSRPNDSNLTEGYTSLRSGSPGPAYSPVVAQTTTSRPRGFSQGLNLVPPTDGSELDPLQRWRGAPVFAWGLGGTIVTSFPKDVPRYGMSSTAPMIVRSPGEVKIQSIKDLSPLEERLVGLPGPLKGKSKKKEVVSWLSSGIEVLERNAQHLRLKPNLTHEDKRAEERVMLWKILRAFIEYDGVLEGNPQVEKAVRSILSPGIDNDSLDAPLYVSGSELPNVAMSLSSAAKPESTDMTTVDQLRKHLLRGDREKAVWEAADKRLWGHAFLISNTVSRELYQKVAQEFVQKEVRGLGENTESLAALYEIFAGNFDESVDELVPPSARAGFQMVSTSTAQGPSKDALDGLDRWRETLCLVLGNRSTNDSQALKSLGNLLSGYGRAEAAHICYLFARSHTVFGGVDDPASSIVLIGSDHLRQPFDFDNELEPILLTEVYEYGLSLSSTSVLMPHLGIYKMQHALFLAEYGYRDKALQYCEAIASAITSQTKRSPYYHPLFVNAVDDLSKRLKQAPKDGSSSWISKPSIDKVSGSVWATFNKFVAGDDQEADSPGTSTGGGDIGPFARIAGGTPTISRSPSNSEIYGSYGSGYNASGAIPIAQPMKMSSRYAPGGTYTPPGSSHEAYPASPYGSHPRGSYERSSSENRRGSYEPVKISSEYRPTSQPAPTQDLYSPQGHSPYTAQSSYTPPSNGDSYAPVSNLTSDHAPANPYEVSSLNSFEDKSVDSANSMSNGYVPLTASNYEPIGQSSYEPPTDQSSAPYGSRYEPPTANTYEPPSTSGYEPPSYEPATMDDEPNSPVDTRPKKKAYMDDDDDDFSLKPSKPVEKTRAEKDREADEAFRKAAEEDGEYLYMMLYRSIHANQYLKLNVIKKLRKRQLRKAGVSAAGLAAQRKKLNYLISRLRLNWVKKAALFMIRN